MELGNHGYGHVDLNSTPLERYQEAVLKGEVVTRRILARRGAQPRYYRHPFTHTGPTREAKAAFEAFLAARGYAVAPFTVEDSDYLFAKAYADARRARNTALAEKGRAAYLDHQDAMFAFYEAEARDLFGRDVPQILLIHANELNAHAKGGRPRPAPASWLRVRLTRRGAPGRGVPQRGRLRRARRTLLAPPLSFRREAHGRTRRKLMGPAEPTHFRGA
jgi:hypothetical protein